MTWVVLESALSGEQKNVVKEFFLDGIQFIVSYIYTLVTTIFDVITEPAVLGAIVVISLIFIGYGWVKKRKIGG